MRQLSIIKTIDQENKAFNPGPGAHGYGLFFFRHKYRLADFRATLVWMTFYVARLHLRASLITQT